jgi:hypothetical protein
MGLGFGEIGDSRVASGYFLAVAGFGSCDYGDVAHHLM